MEMTIDTVSINLYLGGATDDGNDATWFKGSMKTVTVYPVPVQQNAGSHIESPVVGQAAITVTGLTGRTVMQQRTVINAGVNTTRSNMGALPSATYFVQLQHQEQKWIRKIVKD